MNEVAKILFDVLIKDLHVDVHAYPRLVWNLHLAILDYKFFPVEIVNEWIRFLLEL